MMEIGGSENVDMEEKRRMGRRRNETVDEKIASVLGSPSAELRNDQRAFMKVRLRSSVQLVYDRWPI